MMHQRLLILDAGIRVVFHTAWMFSLFLLFAGHNTPGGGFSGGLVAGAALVLRFLSGSRGELRHFDRMPPETLLGAGVLIAGLTGVAAWVAGGEFLESRKATLDVAVLGDVHLTSALAFDTGVYLVVVGLVAAILERLASEERP